MYSLIGVSAHENKYQVLLTVNDLTSENMKCQPKTWVQITQLQQITTELLETVWHQISFHSISHQVKYFVMWDIQYQMEDMTYKMDDAIWHTMLIIDAMNIYNLIAF